MRQHNFGAMVQSLFRRVLRRTTRPARDGLESNAALGDADAQFHLGFMHSSGISGTPDYARAAEWYRKAADQNHALAQVNLGTMYDSGQGMEEDGREAVIWFTKAALQGDAGAQHRLGMRSYRESIQGLPNAMMESRIQACQWFILASQQSYCGSQAAHAQVSLKMTRDDVAEAARRADQFTRRVRELSNEA